MKELPDDCIKYICQYIKYGDLMRLRIVNKNIYNNVDVYIHKHVNRFSHEHVSGVKNYVLYILGFIGKYDKEKSSFVLNADKN